MPKLDGPGDRPALKKAPHEERVIEEIEFEIRQWYAGGRTLRECSENIYGLFAGCGIPREALTKLRDGE